MTDSISGFIGNASPLFPMDLLVALFKHFCIFVCRHLQRPFFFKARENSAKTTHRSCVNVLQVESSMEKEKHLVTLFAPTTGPLERKRSLNCARR